MVKLQRNNKGTYTLTIPKAIVEAKEWKPQMEFDIRFGSKGEVCLQEKQ